MSYCGGISITQDCKVKVYLYCAILKVRSEAKVELPPGEMWIKRFKENTSCGA